MGELVGTIVCHGCGGAVRRDAKACPYCGGEVVLRKPLGASEPAERRTYCARCATLYPADAARCPRCPPGATDARGGWCPRCAGALAPTTMGSVTVDRCAACGGTWFDGDELEHAVDLTTRGVSSTEAAEARRSIPRSKVALEREVRYLACVRCGERMARRQVARGAGVVVDLCRDHGVWFDRDELETFVAFARAGGLEVVRFDGVAAAEARRRLAELKERVPAPLSPMGGAFDADAAGWVAGGLVRALLRLLGP